MTSIVKFLAVSLGLIGALGAPAVAASSDPGARVPANAYHRLARTSPVGDTSLYDIFRGGRYDVPRCFFGEPLSETCAMSAPR